MVHRLLEKYLREEKSADKETYETQCAHSSQMEKVASDAERASIKYKQVEFMQGTEDREFDGIVSGVTKRGVYVEITETRCEGMVRLSEIEDDFYEVDTENFRTIGKNNKRIISLGDGVKVKVTATNFNKRTIDLAFVF